MANPDLFPGLPTLSEKRAEVASKKALAAQSAAAERARIVALAASWESTRPPGVTPRDVVAAREDYRVGSTLEVRVLCDNCRFRMVAPPEFTGGERGVRCIACGWFDTQTEDEL